MINSEGMSEVLTMAQHLELPINARIECNKTFMRCTAEAKGGQNKALIWMRHNIRQSTCKQILDDVNSSSTCMERMVKWGMVKAASRCGAHSSCKYDRRYPLLFGNTRYPAFLQPSSHTFILRWSQLVSHVHQDLSRSCLLPRLLKCDRLNLQPSPRCVQHGLCQHPIVASFLVHPSPAASVWS